MFSVDHRGMAEFAGGAALVGLAAARHMPIPYEDQTILAWAFDTVQDVTKNNDRIGLRRSRPELSTTSAREKRNL